MLPTLSRRGIVAARALAVVLCIVEAVLLAKLYLPHLNGIPQPTAVSQCPMPTLLDGPSCAAGDDAGTKNYATSTVPSLHLTHACPGCLACPSSSDASPFLTLDTWTSTGHALASMAHGGFNTHPAMATLASPFPASLAASGSANAQLLSTCGHAHLLVLGLVHPAACDGGPADDQAQEQWLQQQHDAQATRWCEWSVQALALPGHHFPAAAAEQEAAAAQAATATAGAATPAAAAQVASEAAQPAPQVTAVLASLSASFGTLETRCKALAASLAPLVPATLPTFVGRAAACVAVALLVLLAAARLGTARVLQLVSPMTPYQASNAGAATPGGSEMWGSRSASPQAEDDDRQRQQGHAQPWWQQQEQQAVPSAWRSPWGTPLPTLPLRLSLGSLGLSLPSFSTSPFTVAPGSAVSGFARTPLTGATASRGLSPSPLRSVLACLTPILAAQPSPGGWQEADQQLDGGSLDDDLQQDAAADEVQEGRRSSVLPMSTLLLPFAPTQMSNPLLPSPLEQHQTAQQYDSSPHLPAAPAESSPPSSMLLLGSPSVISAVKAVADMLPSPIASMMTGSKQQGSRYNTRTRARQTSGAGTPSQSHAGGADSDGGDSEAVSRQASDLSGAALRVAGGLLGSAQKAARGVLTRSARSARKAGATLVPVPDDEQVVDQDEDGAWASAQQPTSLLFAEGADRAAGSRQRSGRRSGR